MNVQLVVTSGTHMGQVIPVTAEKFIIGRATDCHLKAKSELISRYHCAILVGEEVIVRDIGSRNGVRLNGEKISTEQKLSHGDILALEPLEFRILIVADGESADAEPNVSGVNFPSDSDGLNAGPLDPTVFLGGGFKALERE